MNIRLANILRATLPDVNYPAYSWQIEEGVNNGARLRAVYMEADVDGDPNVPVEQHTRWWVVSQHAIKSEVVQTMFKCILTSMEHRAREHFTYRGRAVFGPHFDIDQLWEVCTHRDVRPDDRSVR